LSPDLFDGFAGGCFVAEKGRGKGRERNNENGCIVRDP